MVSVGDKARVIKGYSIGYEDTITRMFLASSREVIYQLGYEFVQCQRDEIEISNAHLTYNNTVSENLYCIRAKKVSHRRNAWFSKLIMQPLGTHQNQRLCIKFAPVMQIFESYSQMNSCPSHIHYFRRKSHVQRR